MNNVTGDAMRMFLLAMAGGTDFAVDCEQRKNQTGMVRADVLPSRYDPADRAALEAAGVVFGEPVDGDPMFMSVVFPAGWRKRSTEHPLWTDLIDDRGRKRASIMYKAAAWDRDAGVQAHARYGVRVEYVGVNGDDYAVGATRVGHLTDGGAVIGTVVKVPLVDPDHSWDAANEAREVTRRWLDAHRPGWQDMTRYWDEPDGALAAELR